jgi:hypothetical protein
MSAISLPINFKALGPFPIDATAVFPNFAALQTHASGATAYPGQICAVTSGIRATIYKLSYDNSIVELLPPRILVEDLIIQGPGIPISVSLSSVDTYQISFLKNIKGPVAVALPPNDGTAKQGDRLVVVYLSTAAPAGSDYAVTVSTANSGLPEAVVLYLKESAEFVFDGTAWQVASATQSSDWQASSGPRQIRNKPTLPTIPPGIVQNFNRSSPAGNTFQLYRENDPFSQPIFLKDVVYEDDTNLPPLPVSLESYLNSRIVQADWNETNSTQPDFIKNKPAIPDAGFTIAMALAL